MKDRHLNDEEIQQYALDSSTCDDLIIEHTSSCEECKARVANYQLLFTGIKQQPQAAFDFNLADLIIAQLPSPRTGSSSDNYFVYLFVLAGIVLTGATLYYFRSYIVSLFANIAPLLIYLTVTTFITLAIILSIDMYKNYQKKLKALDLY